MKIDSDVSHLIFHWGKQRNQEVGWEGRGGGRGTSQEEKGRWAKAVSSSSSVFLCFMEIVHPFFSGDELPLSLPTIPMPLPLGQPHSVSVGWLSACCISVCLNTWCIAINVWDFWHAHRYANNAFDCTRGLYESLSLHWKLTRGRKKKKNPLPHREVQLEWEKRLRTFIA